MQLADFIQSIEKEFEDLPANSLKGETQFRKLDNWSSMMALILIAKIDSDYDVTVTAEELARCITISDLYATVHSKAA